MSFFKNLKHKVSNKDRQNQHRDEHDVLPGSGQSLRKDHNHSPEITYGNTTTEANESRIASLTPNASSHYQASEPYNAPPRAPPSSILPETNPPPYESWLSIPDNSQLPPPPSIANEFSPSNNASFHSAESGHKWCAKYTVFTPAVPRNQTLVRSSQNGELGLDPPPPGFKGTLRQLNPRTWEVKTTKHQKDAILTSTLPVYFAAVSNPLLDTPSNPTQTTTRPITFSFSLSISDLHRSAGIAFGFTCKPYPPFRLPGWHRGSLAIHSDDGHRYINDPYGGIEFMRPLSPGDEVKISMTVSATPSPVQDYRGKVRGVKRVGTLPKCVTRVQVERNGAIEGGWDVHEERDGEKDEGIEGLQGEADLYVAVGVFGLAEFVVRYEQG